MRLNQCIPLLLCILYCCVDAQEYVTSIHCNSDEDCNEGVCQDDHVCRCVYLYYPNDSNTIACNTPSGLKHPTLIRTLLVVWLSTNVLFMAIHTGVLVAFTRARRRHPPRNKNWQVDPRLVISLLWCTAFLRIIHFFFVYLYCFGEIKSTRWQFMADLERILFFEVGAAIIFYWFIAVSAVANRKRMYRFLRVPVLAIIGFIFLVWLFLGNFGLDSPNKSVRDGSQMFRLYFVLMILLAIIIGLFYYGLKISKLLAPKEESTKKLVSRISKALVVASGIISCAAAFQIVELSVPLFTQPIPYVILFFCEIIIDCIVHGTTLMIFGGGTVEKFINTILYVFTFKRFGVEFKNELQQLEHDHFTSVSMQGSRSSTCLSSTSAQDGTPSNSPDF